MFRKLSLKSKLLLLCFALSMITVSVGIVGFWSLDKVNRKYDHVASINLPNVESAGEMLALFRRVRITVRTLGLSGLTQNQAAEAISGAKEAIEKYEQANKDYLAQDFLPGEKEVYTPVAESWEKFKGVGAEVIRLYQSGKPEDLQKMNHIFFQECPESAAAYSDAINKLIAFHRNDSKLTASEAHAAMASANWLMLSLTIGGLGMALGVGWAFSTSISRTIQQVASSLADGAEKVATASEDVASASRALSASATEQAAALQETSAGIDETSSMVTKNAENAQLSAQVSETSKSTVSKGKQIVGEMIDSIAEVESSNREIMQQIETSYGEISEIVKLISEIGNKTKVINDIVFQTKLLSFNASVEAARAGEHGKGFAVVAEEVGNLAQMSGNSAKEITQMLDNSIQKVEHIVKNSKSSVERLVEAGKQKVQASTVTAKRCGEVLDEVVGHVNDVGSRVNEIAAACKEQAQGVHEITKAMGQLDQVGQQNNTSSIQVSSSAEELKTQVEGLRAMVGKLHQTVSGGAQESSSAPPPAKGSASAGGTVLSFPASSQAGKPASVAKKKAAGAENIPAQNDPRFEEV